MRFLLDNDVFGLTAKFLRAEGHNIVTVAEIGKAAAPDTELLTLAVEQQRIFVTRDRDFGNLVFIRGHKGGVIYLRIQPVSTDAVHAELQMVLNAYTEAELLHSFVVVEPQRFRIRRIVLE
jgi:predicted nuclease of predicted toxin-antitoxin system